MPEVQGGTDLVTVAESMGHASLDSTRIYTLPTEDDLDAAVARLTVDRRGSTVRRGPRPAREPTTRSGRYAATGRESEQFGARAQRRFRASWPGTIGARPAGVCQGEAGALRSRSWARTSLSAR